MAFDKIYKQRAVTEFLAAEKETVENIYERLVLVYGDEAVDRITIGRWATQRRTICCGYHIDIKDEPIHIQKNTADSEEIKENSNSESRKEEYVGNVNNISISYEDNESLEIKDEPLDDIQENAADSEEITNNSNSRSRKEESVGNVNNLLISCEDKESVEIKEEPVDCDEMQGFKESQNANESKNDKAENADLNSIANGGIPDIPFYILRNLETKRRIQEENANNLQINEEESQSVNNNLEDGIADVGNSAKDGSEDSILKENAADSEEIKDNSNLKSRKGESVGNINNLLISCEDKESLKIKEEPVDCDEMQEAVSEEMSDLRRKEEYVGNVNNLLISCEDKESLEIKEEPVDCDEMQENAEKETNKIQISNVKSIKEYSIIQSCEDNDDVEIQENKREEIESDNNDDIQNIEGNSRIQGEEEIANNLQINEELQTIVYVEEDEIADVCIANSSLPVLILKRNTDCLEEEREVISDKNKTEEIPVNEGRRKRSRKSKLIVREEMPDFTIKMTEKNLFSKEAVSEEMSDLKKEESVGNVNNLLISCEDNESLEIKEEPVDCDEMQENAEKETNKIQISNVKSIKEYSIIQSCEDNDDVEIKENKREEIESDNHDDIVQGMRESQNDNKLNGKTSLNEEKSIDNEIQDIPVYILGNIEGNPRIQGEEEIANNLQINEELQTIVYVEEDEIADVCIANSSLPVLILKRNTDCLEEEREVISDKNKTEEIPVIEGRRKRSRKSKLIVREEMPDFTIKMTEKAKNLFSKFVKDRTQTRSQMSFMSSFKEGPKLTHKGYEYNLDKVECGETYWKCVACDCSGWAKTFCNVILDYPTTHNHPPDGSTISKHHCIE